MLHITSQSIFSLFLLLGHLNAVRCAIVNKHLPHKRASPWKPLASHSGKDFFGQWDFFTAADPTNGAVQYVGRDEASSLGLARIDNNGAAIIAADTKSNNGAMKSVRITDSSKPLQVGSLVLLDASHMPTGCGTWPSIWAFGGPNWPNGGEIDIVEGVHTNTRNKATLHTSAGCEIDLSQAGKGFTGGVGNAQCAASGSNNAGCDIVDNRNDNSFGAGFNAIQGGVYAMQIVDAGISVWFFERSKIPGDIQAGTPDPSAWGLPVGFWASSTCNMNHFKDLKMIINLSLCGDFAGPTWATSGCQASTGANSCAEYVKSSPDKFGEAYFAINYVKSFTLG